MPSSVQIGSAAHKCQRAHDTEDQGDLGLVSPHREHVLRAQLKDPKVVDEVCQEREHSSANSADPKQDELRIVVCCCTDPSVGKWLLVTIELREEIAPDDGTDPADSSDQGNNPSWKLTDEHLYYISDHN